MISDISSWASGIVTAVMIVTILEMLLPEGNNKKYIKTVMSVYLLFTILSPVIKFFSKQEINFENIIEIKTEVPKNVTIETSSSVENVYIANLKKDIAYKLKEKRLHSK